MKTYQVYIINRVKAVLFYILFYITGFFISVLVLDSLILDSETTGLLALLIWLLLFPVVYYISIYFSAKEYTATINNDRLELRRNGTRFFRIERNNIDGCIVRYSSRGPKAVLLLLKDGKRLRLHGRSFVFGKLEAFGILVTGLQRLADEKNRASADAAYHPIADDSGAIISTKQDIDDVPATLPEVIICKALKVYNWLAVIGFLVAVVNALFIGLILIVIADDGITAATIVSFILCIAEAVGVFGLFAILFRRKVDVHIYNDRVVIMEVKKYWIQSQKQYEYYYKDITSFVVWHPYRSNTQITLTDKRNKKCRFVEYFPFVFSKEHTAYYVVNTLSASFEAFTAAYKTGVKIKVKNSRDLSGLELITDIFEMFR